MQAEAVAESRIGEGEAKAVRMDTLREARPCHSHETLLRRLREMMKARPPAIP